MQNIKNDPEKVISILENCIDQKLVSSGVINYLVEIIQIHCIPKKIKEIHCDEYFCPNCGSENNASEYEVCDSFCPVCGQKLLNTDN